MGEAREPRPRLWLLTHIHLHDDRTDEVVLVCLGDLDVVNRADLRVAVFGYVVDEHVAVDMVMYPMKKSSIY